MKSRQELQYARSLARYDRIVAARNEGLSLADIARIEHVSRQRIRQILEAGPPKAVGRPSESRPLPDLRQHGDGDELERNLNMTVAVRDIDRAETALNTRGHEHTPEEYSARLGDFVIPGQLAFAELTPPTMEKLLFISSFDQSDPDSPAPQHHGYQREPMWSRIPGIAKYFLVEDHRTLLTPLLVSVRLHDPVDLALFRDMLSAGDIEGIHRTFHRAVCSLVDGQHRFLGLVKAHNTDPTFNPLVPVMLYFGLDYEQEAELFDIINVTQRKLPKALIETTKGDITKLGDKDYPQSIRVIAFALARDEDSVWYDEVNMTGASDRTRRVTYEGLRRSTENMFSQELLSRLRKRGMSATDVAKSYWSMVAEACSTAWNNMPSGFDENGDPISVEYRIKELVGVASLARLGKDIIHSALEASSVEDRMAELTSALGEVDWEKREGNPWMASQAGFAGQKDLYTMLYELVYNGHKPGEPTEG